jgi:ERCC4-type nuclease
MPLAIRVVVDMRETALYAELSRYHAEVGEEPAGGGVAAEGWCVESAALHVGDVAFYVASPALPTIDLSGASAAAAGGGAPTPLVVLERKTADDLAASQRDGRYREQRARLFALRGAGTAIGYVLEFPSWSPGLTRTWGAGGATGAPFTEKHLQTAMVRLHLRYTIPTFQSSSVKETAVWIQRIAQSLVADSTAFSGGVANSVVEAAAAYTEAIHVKKADNCSPDRIFWCFLMSIPGMGKAAATALSTRTGNSLIALQALTLDQLLEVQVGKRRLGKALATAIYEAVHS